MLDTNLCIKSDFIDYYDKLTFVNNNNENGITYRRMLSDCMQRGSALKYLRSLGIKTIDIKQASAFSYLDKNLVVYTDPKKHNGEGKRVMSYEEAVTFYSNFPASKYIEDSGGYTVKVLQIGKRRFTLTFKKDINEKSIREGMLVDIKEMTPAYNMLIGLPIFSIDYVACNYEMIATDFNEVENLSRLGLDRYLSSHDICGEIINSLYKYNKVERN